MSGQTALYVGSLLDGGVADVFEIEDYSLAGEHKKRSVIKALQAVDTDVIVVSPVLLTGSEITAYRGDSLVDNELGVTIRVPASIGIFGLEFVVLALTTLAVVTREAYQRDVDVILFYNFKIQTAIPAVVGSWVANAPLIVEYEDGMFVDPETAAVVRFAARWLRQLTGRVIDGGICASQPLADLLKTDNVVTFRGFPSVGMPDDLPEPVDTDGPPVVMFSGRFDGVRGIDTFLEVAPLVAQHVDEVRFWISGYGDEETCSRVEADAASLPCDVSYFGTLPWDEYRAKIARADILVNFQDPTLPISEFTFPSKILDYMSAGAIVVSTDVGDLRPAFDDELCVVNHDPPRLASVVASGLTDDEMAEYGTRAERWVRTNCTVEKAGERIGRVIDRTVEGPARDNGTDG